MAATLRCSYGLVARCDDDDPNVSDPTILVGMGVLLLEHTFRFLFCFGRASKWRAESALFPVIGREIFLVKPMLTALHVCWTLMVLAKSMQPRECRGKNSNSPRHASPIDFQNFF